METESEKAVTDNGSRVHVYVGASENRKVRRVLISGEPQTAQQLRGDGPPVVPAVVDVALTFRQQELVDKVRAIGGVEGAERIGGPDVGLHVYTADNADWESIQLQLLTIVAVIASVHMDQIVVETFVPKTL